MNEQQEFEAWWDQDCDTRQNPYSQHSMMYWAWEAWKAGREAEREACAKVCEEPGWNAANWCAKAIRARGLQELNKEAEKNGEEL
jgi:hypothetical protein